MISNEEAIKLAKKYINKEPIPSSLQAEFKCNGMENLLKGIYNRTAELILDNTNFHFMKWGK